VATSAPPEVNRVRLTVGGDRLDYLVTTLRQHDHHQVPPQHHLPPDARFMCMDLKVLLWNAHGTIQYMRSTPGSHPVEIIEQYNS
jgi:hypothetical protein